jgi:hypothetical protein
VVLVAERNTGARAFHQRRGFVLIAKVIGQEYYAEAMEIDL